MNQKTEKNREKITMGTTVRTLVDKWFDEGVEVKKIFIPRNTIGLVAETHDQEGREWAWVEIWGEGAPKGVSGVFDYYLDELDIYKFD